MEKIKRKPNRLQMKQNRQGAAEYLTFPLIEETGAVRHLFSTRLGVVSDGFLRPLISLPRGVIKKRR